uniref:Uncharacterized protein n=1 Tax=Cacopsylla melanoneura TaxID=428564 RepID=A0A8D8PZH3_9HEMI
MKCFFLQLSANKTRTICVGMCFSTTHMLTVLFEMSSVARGKYKKIPIQKEKKSLFCPKKFPCPYFIKKRHVKDFLKTPPPLVFHSFENRNLFDTVAVILLSSLT